MLEAVVNKFNRGEVSADALARLDVEKLRDSSARMENFWPVRLGPMGYRPGTELIGSLSSTSKLVEFVKATDDTALIELTPGHMYVWVNDTKIARTSVTSSIANGEFTGALTDWTDADETGAVSHWDSGNSGQLRLVGNGSANAIRYQTIAATDTGNEHGIRIKINSGSVTVQIGTSGSGSGDIYNGALGPGEHALVFTPSSNITITLKASHKYASYVEWVRFDTAGTLDIPLPIAYSDQLDNIRIRQSADVIYVTSAYDGSTYGQIAPFKIERRGVKSWSVVDFRADDGPFGFINSTDIQLTPGALLGDTTLAASSAIFTPDHVGALFKLTSAGQSRTASVTAEDNGTDSIFVTGVGATSRRFTFTLTGTWSGTVTLQRSADNVSWADVNTYTTNGTRSYNDSLDNSELYYRLWIKPGDYTSGTVGMELVYASGSIDGVCRVTGYTDETQVDVQVLKDFGATDATRNWYEGEWSVSNGYPTSLELYEGRLWFAGKNKLWGSVSDSYGSFDTTIEGDSASIRRTIGFGPVDNIFWLRSSNRLLMGLASDEVGARSSSLGEVLTPNNINLKSGSNQGCANVDSVVVDEAIFYVQRSLKKVMSLQYSPGTDSHTVSDLMTLNPQFSDNYSLSKLAFVRQPETRLLGIMSDGRIGVHLFDPVEKVTAWSKLSSTTVDFQDLATFPGTDEDVIYLKVKLGSNYYLAKMAKTTECEGGATSKHYDLFVHYTSPGTTLTGLSHLEGLTVGVWADGSFRGEETVSSGQVTVASSWTSVTVGLRYTAYYKSNKLTGHVGTAQAAYVLGHRKRVVNTGLIGRNLNHADITIGPTEALMKALPLIENGTTAASHYSEYDEAPFDYEGESETDPRIYLDAVGPCTILALTYAIKNPNPPSAQG